jgi:tetratricopeptide (TPR) repeat protein
VYGVKILAGPENMTYVTEMLRMELQGHELLTFNNKNPGLKFTYPNSTFQEVLEQLPANWEPDLVIWWLPEFQTVLPGIDECPYPTLLLISDWHVISDPLIEIAGMFDLVGTDLEGLDLLQKASNVRAFHAPLYGFHPQNHVRIPDLERVYDVSHVGDLNPYLHIERVRTLVEAAMGLKNHSVRFFQHIYGKEYTKLLNQSRITINYALRQEMSMRCYEAPACGSLLFCEESNREVRQILEDGKECVLYNSGNLVERLSYYLKHDAEREEMAEAGYQRIQDYSYPKQGQRMLEKVVSLLESRPDRTFHTLALGRRKTAYANYCCQVISMDPPLLARQQAEEALAATPDDPFLHNLLGCIRARLADFATDMSEREQHYNAAINHFEQALDLGLVAHLNLAGTLMRDFQLQRALAILLQATEPGVRFLDVAFFPRVITPMTILWEKDRRGRENTARWRLYEMLSELVPDEAVSYIEKALSYRNDISSSWFRLAMFRPPGSPKIVGELKKACALDPSFLAARRALAEVLAEQGRSEEATQLTTSTDLLCQRYPVAATVTTTKNLQEKLSFFSFLSADAKDDIEDFVSKITFRWLPPDHVTPPQMHELHGRGLEFSNTVFPERDAEIKESLLRLQLVPRMSTMAIAAVIQRAVSQMPEQLSFVNVGVWHGFSFLAGLLGNPQKRCIGVDNFSQFGGPEEEFRERYESLRGPRHSFHAMDYREYFQDVHEGLVGVYFYDGEHSYENQLHGLEVAEPFFAPGCLILVDDTNWEDPRKATLDFMNSRPGQYKILWDVQTADTRHISWWNGLMILQYKGGKT